MYIESIKNGFKKGLTTLWSLTKIVVPVYFLVTFLKMTPLLNMISSLFEPAMKVMGLPGEASVVLVVGNLVGLYAGLGAITSLTLTVKQVTILAVMLLFSHGLLLESAVAKRTGVSLSLVLSIRISLAVVSGITLNLML